MSSLPPHLYQPRETRTFDFNVLAFALAAVGVWSTAITADNRGVSGRTLYIREFGWLPAGAAPPATSTVTLRILRNGIVEPGFAGLRGDFVGTPSTLTGCVIPIGENEWCELQFRDDVGGAGRAVDARLAGWSSTP